MATCYLDLKSLPLPSHFDPKTFTHTAFDDFDHNQGLNTIMTQRHFFFKRLMPDGTKSRKPLVSETDVKLVPKAFHAELLCQATMLETKGIQ